MDENGYISCRVTLLQAAKYGLHMRVIVCVYLEVRVRMAAPVYIANTCNRKDDVSLGREGLKELKVLNSANSGLQSEGLKFLCLLLGPRKGCDLEGAERGVCEKTSEDGAANIAFESCQRDSNCMRQVFHSPVAPRKRTGVF